jgi:hypothetical protein
MLAARRPALPAVFCFPPVKFDQENHHYNDVYNTVFRFAQREHAEKIPRSLRRRVHRSEVAAEVPGHQAIATVGATLVLFVDPCRV